MNLTIYHLPRLVDEASVSNSLVALIEKAKTASDFCRDWRNRLLAHSDYDLALGNGANPIEKATIEQIKAAISSLADVLNVVSQHYVNLTTPFELNHSAGGALSLVRLLEDGLAAKANRQATLKRGESATGEAFREK